MTSYKLFAVDIDGTLCVPGQEIPLQVIQSLRKCAESGILIVLSTGKQFKNIQHLCHSIGIEGPVVTCNGAITVRVSTQERLCSHFMPKTLYRTIVSDIESDDRANIAVFTDNDIACTGINLASEILNSIGEPTTLLVNSLLDLSTENVAKVLVAVENPKTLRCLYDLYSRQYARDCSVTITSDKFVEFMSMDASKGKAVLKVAQSTGITKEHIACIGDSDNDLSMFEIAGLNIAVGNATPSVLRVADVVMPPASEYGVVEAINNLISGEINGDGYR